MIGAARGNNPAGPFVRMAAATDAPADAAQIQDQHEGSNERTKAGTAKVVNTVCVTSSMWLTIDQLTTGGSSQKTSGSQS